MNYIYTAPEYLAPLLVIIIIALIMSWNTVTWTAAALLVGLLVFFRGWTGPFEKDASKIMCPCDGRILRIVPHPETGFVQIAIFLNVHNNHVQYMPCDGMVQSTKHKEGEFHPAYLFEKSALNERQETVIRTQIGDITVVQIAGLVARRIVSFVKANDSKYKGDPLGLIKFGSRVDIWLPMKQVQVRADLVVGKRVRIGDTLATIFDQRYGSLDI